MLRSLAKTISGSQNFQATAFYGQRNVLTDRQRYTGTDLFFRLEFFFVTQSSAINSIPGSGPNRKHSTENAAPLLQTWWWSHGSHRSETEA